MRRAQADRSTLHRRAATRVGQEERALHEVKAVSPQAAVAWLPRLLASGGTGRGSHTAESRIESEKLSGRMVMPGVASSAGAGRTIIPPRGSTGGQEGADSDARIS